jgi:hypothetical protein
LGIIFVNKRMRYDAATVIVGGPMPAKCWKDKLHQPKQPKRVVLETDFAGIKAGTMLFVGTPLLIDRYIRTIPRGETRTIERMRRDLARKHKCEATCPVSTAIFIRMSAEAALEEMSEGVAIESIAPFWRVVEPESKIATRLSVDSKWIAAQREMERG